jgi:alkylation response protein AidB-like acyl-CoA dehydrogenase
MNFDLNAEQLRLRREITRFAQTELRFGAERLDQDEQFDAEGWAKCGAFGLLGLPAPAELGGRGLDPLAAVVAIEALALGCSDNGLVFAVCNHLFACVAPILKFGTAWQKTTYLPGLANGALIGAHAMTEPLSGSETSSIGTTAVRCGDSYVLHGNKIFITNGPVADVFVVFARTSAAHGASCLSAFVVEKDTPGLHVGPPISKMGLRSAPMSEIFLEDCEVTQQQRLGQEGDGALVFAVTTELERFYLSAMHLGAMKRQLARCVEYVQERQQFGHSLAGFQAVTHKLAQIKVDIELAEPMLYKIAWLHQSRRAAFFESATIKLFTSEAYVRASLAALEIHGALGYTQQPGVERQVRDSLAAPIYAGTSNIQREIIVAWLGLDACAQKKPQTRNGNYVPLQTV